MIRTTSLESEAWRPFVAKAPDLFLEVNSGFRLHIDLFEYLKQGAVEIDTGLSPLSEEEDPLFFNSPLASRGWQYDIVINGEPANGTVEHDEFRKGLYYKPNDGFVGNDCFNFVLTNKFQQSFTGKINVNVKEFYVLDVTVTKTDSPFNFDLAAAVIPPTEAEPPYLVKYDWSFVGAAKDGGNVVYKSERFDGTHLRSTGWRGNSYTVLDVGDNYPNQLLRHDSIFEGLIDSKTGVPFVPQNKFVNVVVTAEVYVENNWKGEPDFTLIFDFEKEFGIPWDESGLIIDPDAPDQDELNGNYVPVFLVEKTEQPPFLPNEYVPNVL